MELKLTKAKIEMAEQIEKFIFLWNGHPIPSILQKYDGNIEKFIDYLHTIETDPPRLMSPSTVLFLTDNTKIYGAAEIRHFLNSGLEKYGGHITFGVPECYRRCGYGFATLKAALTYAKKLNIDQLLLCCTKDNTAAAKTILKCGGILENEISVIENGCHVTGQRYWIDIQQNIV